jgi:hypothetical protein
VRRVDDEAYARVDGIWRGPSYARKSQRPRFDREGQPRTAHNLRHTYICLRLMANIYQIAKNRTSVE